MITAHLRYLGFYDARKTCVLSLKDQHVYKITRIERGIALPIGWTNNTVLARVGDCITEDQLRYAICKEVQVDIT
jgi:hypothetical protein